MAAVTSPVPYGNLPRLGSFFRQQKYDDPDD